MNLLQFAIKYDKYLDSLTDEYAKEFVRLKTECFWKYHWLLKKAKDKEEKEYIVCITLGLDYFKEIIRCWNNPEDFYKTHPQYEPGTKKESLYNANFVKVIQENKKRSHHENNY